VGDDWDNTMAFCKWARGRYGRDVAETYIREDIYEDINELCTRLVRDHFAVWAEFMAHNAAEKMGVSDVQK
jgi:hypothetical protein